MLTVQCAGCHSPLRVREEYAGMAMRCPTCGTLLRGPGEEVIEVRPIANGQAARTNSTRTKACPHCRERSPLRAEKCRFCGRSFTTQESHADEPGQKLEEYLPCPSCGTAGAERVRWTFWGSFYGPTLLTHVRCPECDYRYNGRTGKSNLLWAILFVVVPALLISAMIGYAATSILRWMGG